MTARTHKAATATARCRGTLLEETRPTEMGRRRQFIVGRTARRQLAGRSCASIRTTTRSDTQAAAVGAVGQAGASSVIGEDAAARNLADGRQRTTLLLGLEWWWLWLWLLLFLSHGVAMIVVLVCCCL